MKKKMLLSGLVLVGSLFVGCGKEKTEVIQLKGSDTILNISQAISEKFMEKNSNYRVSVTGGGSGVGISSIINKTADIAMVSRSIKGSEFEKARDNGVNVEEMILGYDGITVIVNKDNDIKDLSSEDLGKIFRGDITNWKELGGENAKITVLSRDSSSGTHVFFKEAVVRGGQKNNLEYGEKTLYAPSNESIKQEIKANKTAIGYIGMGYVDDTIHPITVNGVEPSVKNVSNKTYPLARAVYWYVPSEKNEGISKLMDFALSNEGQQIVKNEGFVPRGL